MSTGHRGNAQRPDPEWVPENGRLFLRVMISPWQNEIEFAYAIETTEKGTVSQRTVARICHWQGQKDVSEVGEWACRRGNIGKTDAGAPVVRKMAYRDDVEALVRLWGDRRTSVVDWCAEIQGLEDLHVTDRAMIAEVVQKCFGAKGAE